MSLAVGLIGLPNVGKSTAFNALTRAGARVENFPFCTIEPNHGVVPVPDARLDALAALLRPGKLVPATVDVVDIAGLVRGAHAGEGLGNQFLGHVRTVDALIHVLRCFGGDVTHVDGSVDPVRDLEVVDLELALADLQTLGRRIDRVRREAKVGVKSARAELQVLHELTSVLEPGQPLRRAALSPPARALAGELSLLTIKPVLYVGNVDEPQLQGTTGPAAALRERLETTADPLVLLLADMEMEIAGLDDPDERQLFLDDLGLQETGLDRLTRAAYELLNLITFYTFVGGKELRAWSIPAGTAAPRAAGRIHTDFERGFIRAEVASVEDFLRLKGESGVRDAGRLRSEGKEYVVKDGEVVRFRFAT